MERVAVMDLGSNSLRMTIFENGIGVKDYRYPVKLAEGMTNNNMLQKEPVKRALDAICEVCEIFSEEKIEHVKAVATEAVRKAANGQDFLREVKGMTGLEIEVIGGKEELYYDYLSVVQYNRMENGLFLDTGGGSCEIGFIKNNKLVGGECLPLGALILAEKFLKYRPGSTLAVEQMESYVKSCLQSLPFLKEAQALPMVVMGGSNRLFGKIDNQDVKEKDLLNYELEAERARQIYHVVARTPVSKRADIPGMETNRIDSSDAGMCPAVMLLQLCKIPRIIVSTKGVREGIAKHLLDKMAKIK